VPLKRVKCRAGEKKKQIAATSIGPRCDMARSKISRTESLIRGTRRRLVELVAADGTEPTFGMPGTTRIAFEPMRCDHCQKSFGLILHRHFRLRFCTADCLTAYQRRLDASRYSGAHSRLGAHAAAASSNRERV
jgi:hypothetical protein